MAKPFAFALKQRVALPTDIAVQAVITSRTDYTSDEPSYRLEWCSSRGHHNTAWFGEQHVTDAQAEALRAAAAASQKPKASPRRRRR